ncbi:MAG: protoheme IX farnesyltransferase [Planctomycetes bacterium]|nr:protoheme IX farnesyltransferase [Planctomycetota bacterium]
MLNRLQGYLIMTKPRAMLVVLVTTAAGWFLAAGAAADWSLLVHLLIGTGLSGGGSIVLNQYLERDHDRRMARTARRPLPSGMVAPREALVYGVALSVLGTAWLALGVNAITAVLGGLCVLSYVLLYTPMKRLSPWNTAVGAVPGAIPPMMGWTAVTGTIGVEAWVLFAILFIWQYPHFLAIGWLFKDDYAGAGYRMLSAVDPAGERTARQVLVNAALLVLVSLLPYGLEQAGLVYASGALLLGLGLFGLGILFHRRRDRAVAALLLKGTILHITLLMTLLVVDRV